MATMALMNGSNCAAAINGMRKSPIRSTLEVQLSGDDQPVSTVSTEMTATSQPIASRVIDSLVDALAWWVRRKAQTPHPPTITTYATRIPKHQPMSTVGGVSDNVVPMNTT